MYLLSTYVSIIKRDEKHNAVIPITACNIIFILLSLKISYFVYDYHNIILTVLIASAIPMITIDLNARMLFHSFIYIITIYVFPHAIDSTKNTLIFEPSFLQVTHSTDHIPFQNVF